MIRRHRLSENRCNAVLLGRQVGPAAKAATSHRTPKPDLRPWVSAPDSVLDIPEFSREIPSSAMQPSASIITLLGLVTASHLAASEFPLPHNTETAKSDPMPAAEAAAKMKLPPGFNATVFAAEPDVQNPIAMAWDGRGRLWVAENYTYAEPRTKFDLRLRDRVLIFEDKNGDGHFDTRKVFTDEVQMRGS